MNILEVKNIVKIYGEQGGEEATTALNGVNLTIKKGEFVAVMGPSGSGKTTLLNVISGIDQQTSGEITISGENISNFSGDELAIFRRQQLGFVFQDFHLLDSLTVKENVMLPMILEKKKVFEIDHRVQELAKTFEIEKILDKYPYNISGGQKQRTAVTRALVNNPSIILADEPTGNLDSKSSAVIMECFEKVVEELFTTVLLVTHDVFAASYCNRVIFIKDGKIHSQIVKKGTRKQFLNQIMDNLIIIGGRTNVF